MLKTVFTVKLNEKILPRLVAIGKFDQIHPCIVAATTTDKVLIHNPNSRALNPDGRWILGGSANDINFLNINQKINCLTTGQLKPLILDDSKIMGKGSNVKLKSTNDNENDPLAVKHNNDLLVIGTPTSLMVYDVLNNSDLFYREIPDGVNVVVIGEIGSSGKPLAIAGGNCALQGFDYQGNDCYWTVTGDNVTAMSLADINNDGLNELIVGSDDHDIRVFKEDAIDYELSETEAITCLCAINKHTFAYSLSNGTVGVYFHKERLWRIKSKNQAISLLSYDINNDGSKELITGWSNGKVDVRNVESGEVLYKDNLSKSIAAVLIADYNLDGINELIVCTVEGEIRGYVAALPVEQQQITDLNYEQDTIRELMKRKQNLTIELKNYEENIRMQQIADPFVAKGKPSMENDSFGAIPANTQLKSAMIINDDNKEPSLYLSLQTSNNTIIRAVVIFAEGIFKGESYVYHPGDNLIEPEVMIPLNPAQNIPIDLHIKAIVGYKGSHHYHVFELTRSLPRFSMFSLIVSPNPNIKPEDFVRFNLKEKIQRIQNWINNNFLLVKPIDYNDSINLHFISLRDKEPLVLEMDSSGNFTIWTNSMSLAGDLVQSLASDYLNLDDLQSEAVFNKEFDQLKQLIEKVEEMQRVKQQLTAEVADNSSAIKALIVKAEDARLINEIKLMKQYYSDLMSLNNDLFTEYKIRCQNHQDLVDHLKHINVIIQKAANLRVGPSKTQLIQFSRNAIKQNNLNLLTKIICKGVS